MKSLHLLLLFLVCVTSSLFSQIPVKLYYDRYWTLTKADSAFYIRECGLDTTKQVFDGAVKDLTKNGELVMEGSYRSGSKEGVFSFYFPSGQVESTGNYSGNNRTGIWKYFYDNGTPKQEIDFSDARPKIIYYNDPSGVRLLENGNGKWKTEYEEYLVTRSILVEGNFLNGAKDGKWICKWSDGEIIYEEKFKDGAFRSGNLCKGRSKVGNYTANEFENKFLPHYKFDVTEKLLTVRYVTQLNYPFIKSLYVSRTRTTTADDPGVTPAEFPGGSSMMGKFIAMNLRYPVAARRTGTEGRVMVGFTIGTDGLLSNFRIVKGVTKELDAEAMRVVTLMPAWQPELKNGVPVKCEFGLPISFKLEN